MEANKKELSRSLKNSNNNTVKLLRRVCKMYYGVKISTEGKFFYVHFENREITRTDRDVIHHLRGQNLDNILVKMLTQKFID